MALAKVILATGASSGVGLEALKQLLAQPQPYKFLLGARDVPGLRTAIDAVDYDKAANPVSILPLDLADLKGVKAFAESALRMLGQEKIDYVLLNAGMAQAAEVNPRKSRWCESMVVNHFSQFYLVHLLRQKVEESQSRVVFVSSGAVRAVTNVDKIEEHTKSGAGTSFQTTYCDTKFAQLLGAHWWRRQLQGKCTVIAVSPGLIPDTKLGRGSGIPTEHPDAKSVSEGGTNILRPFWRDDLPSDPDQIFLTSWGEWWPSKEIKDSLDKKLQDKWCPSLEQFEKDEGLV